MTTQEKTKVDQRDMDMIHSPNLWPCWPFLPVKRYVDRKCIVGIVTHDDVRTVHDLNLARGWTSEEFDVALATPYASVEAMLEDGWMVD